MSTMLKGYTIPSPGASDGEYGGFSGVRFAGYAQSPVNHPYWAGQGIANTIPALNGYGDQHSQDVLHSHDGFRGFGDEAASVPVVPLVLGAIVGRLVLGNMRGAAIGAAAGYFFRDKFPKLAGFGLMMGPQQGVTSVNSGSMGPDQGATAPANDGTSPDTMNTHSDSAAAPAGSLGGGMLVVGGLLVAKYLFF